MDQLATYCSLHLDGKNLEIYCTTTVKDSNQITRSVWPTHSEGYRIKYSKYVGEKLSVSLKTIINKKEFVIASSSYVYLNQNDNYVTIDVCIGDFAADHDRYECTIRFETYEEKHVVSDVYFNIPIEVAKKWYENAMIYKMQVLC